MRGCHVHPTSGHMGTKKTQARIIERYMWQGVGKDVKAFVSTYLYSYTLGVYIYAEVYHAVDALQFRIAD